MGGGCNKVFRDLAGQAVLSRSVRALAAAGVIRFVIALRDEDRPLFERLVRPALPPELIVDTVSGGEEREDSVYAGLQYLAQSPSPPRWVLVHDAARPLVPPHLVVRVLEAARRYGAAVPGLPVTDTGKRGTPLAAGAPRRAGEGAERGGGTVPRQDPEGGQ
ncbi:MAG: bifunctional 2-C-methyl-D-erythritol 4-phosphate cytidylyltransferase/2-C-methyl-D-erythritol 2,4-cyclodiphosphate synthase, partial [Bacillota bacterium]